MELKELNKMIRRPQGIITQRAFWWIWLHKPKNDPIIIDSAIKKLNEDLEPPVED